MEGHAASPPQHILGYTIHSKTRIYVSYLLPAALELACYIVQIVADTAVSIQHFRSNQSNFGWATFSLILIPPVLTFILVVSSRDQWTSPKHAKPRHFFATEVLCLLFFPFVATYRFARRIFWSIEALFQVDDDMERMLCLAKAQESSTCELYHMIQAYGQSAPQILLQLYHMLTQDLFRNFETTNVQAISLVFSAIDLAAITTTYQRFESQKLAGRTYPWSSPKQIAAQKTKLACAERYRAECERRKRESERTIASFPENDTIMANFKQRDSTTQEPIYAHTQTVVGLSEVLTHVGTIKSFDEVDNEGGNDTAETTVLLHNSAFQNVTDDEKIQTRPKLKLSSIREERQPHLDAIEVLDTVPDSPAPTLPSTVPSNIKPIIDHVPSLKSQTSCASESNLNHRRHERASNTISQLETFKNMLIVNAQLYIKENMPRPPKMLLTRIDPDTMDLKTPPHTPPAPSSPEKVDDVDFFFSQSTKIVNGIEQDDFAGKIIAFFGWIAFVIMRMLAFSSYCVFFPKSFLIIVGIHYLVMLSALFLESRFNGKLNRTLFYMVLAYVYIYVLLEFRIKFKRIRWWFIGYFLITMSENITMTMLWYAREEFESWWFGFIYEGIIYSGILFVATLLVYYYFLKPKNVVFVMEADDQSTNRT